MKRHLQSLGFKVMGLFVALWCISAALLPMSAVLYFLSNL